MAKIKKIESTKYWWEYRTYRTLIKCLWECKVVAFRKLFGSTKVKQIFIIWPGHSTPRNFSMRNESVCPNKDIYLNVYMNVLVLKVEALCTRVHSCKNSKCSSDEWIDCGLSI